MSNKSKDYANKVLQIDPLSDRLGNVGFTGGASKKLTSLKNQKIKKEKLKAGALLGVTLPTVGILGKKKIEAEITKDYGYNPFKEEGPNTKKRKEKKLKETAEKRDKAKVKK
tara:strand:+ start:86 stop:421 length:336 start_codon:yes stop_codon:yes gene_type:complete